MTLFYYVIPRHLTGHPSRTALTVIGIALGVAVAIAIHAANVDVLTSFEESVLSVAGSATLQVTGDELGLDETIVEAIRAHPAVVSAMPVLHLTGSVVTASGDRRPLTLIALDLFDLDVKRVRLKTDTARDTLDTILMPNAVFLGRRAAREWGAQIGSTIEVAVGGRRYQLVMKGSTEPEGRSTSTWDALGVMDIAAAQSLFGLVGRLDRIDVTTEPHASVETVRRELQAMLPAGVRVARPAGRTEQVERMVQAFQLNLTVLSSVSLLVGLFLVYNAASFSVVQRRREIGILSAMGLSKYGIALLFVFESVVVGMMGGLLGTAGGLILARALIDRLTRTISDLYVPLESAAIPASLLQFLADTPAVLWLEGLLLGVGISVLGALIPSGDAARTPAAKVLAPGDYEIVQRGRTGVTAVVGLVFLLLAAALAVPGPVMGLPLFGYASALALLLGLSCVIPLMLKGFSAGVLMASGSHQVEGRTSRLPFWARLAAEQVGRAPGRNAVTISAMMVGMAIMVGVGTMVGSFRDTVQLWIDQTIVADFILAPTNWLQGHEAGQVAERLPAFVAEEVARTPGVAAVDPYRDVTIDVRGHRTALVSRDLALHAERSRYLFTAGQSSEILQRTLKEQGVVVSEVLARTFGLRVGESLELTTPTGVYTFPVVGIFYDYATDGGKIVMDRALYRRLWRDENVTVVAVYLARDADPGAVRRAIEQRLFDAVGSGENRIPPVVIANHEVKREVMAIFDRTFTVTYALELIAIIIAVLGIINTLVTSVLQRRREFAVLRSMGTTPGHVRRLMLWESAYLGVLGAALGVLGGLLLSLLLVHVINKQSFGWTIQFSIQPVILVQSAAIAVLAAILAGYLPARWAARQPIVDGLRYE